MKKNKLELFDLLPQGLEEKKILNERAQQLANPIKDISFNIRKDYFIRFKLGQEYYGIPFEYLKEVILGAKLTPVPNVPDFIVGIFNHQGVLLSVLNLKSFFDIQGQDAPQNKQLIVIQSPQMTAALLIDGIEGIESYEVNDLDPPLKNSIKTKYVIGLHEGITTLLNIELLLLDLLLDK